MKQTHQEKQQIQPEVVQMTTLFDSEEAEYELIKEREAKAEKEKAGAKIKTE